MQGPNSPKDPERRRWLTATAVAGGAGLIATSVPFVASMAPSERARALGAPVELSLNDIAPGELRSVAWRGKPVFVLRRSPEMLDALTRHDDLLADPHSLRSEQPAFARNTGRSVKPEFSVMVGLCTHLGCIPTFRPVPGAADLGASWPGGFFCPCHGSKFDLSGRVFKSVPAPTNLEVPVYHFAGDNRLVIGVDPVG
ncbi:MAG: ubiquinol-cytochrome c reductase iron-sulfur subunit [Polaromonas sp.]|uniref:ubiquinol-cytochrome c reductase iron-sulfur subunit n=1 Tax=Polaromonas sp. TaxID=1869339 RepID=UPI002488953A|nr:ubiquinol-cytochrome c reductase iron-sulfur subunit [Polaromonas sp.]MDI1238130.1 ubiquinol-cytochrome c reductase iron-sulfur subunit [Polaromonas sp.]